MPIKADTSTVAVLDSFGRIGVVNLAQQTVTVLPGQTERTDPLTDIAISPWGELYGVSGTSLYRINQTNAHTVFVGTFAPTSTAMTALGFNADGTLYAGDSTGAVYTLDPQTAKATRTSFQLPGAVSDLVAAPDGVTMDAVTPTSLVSFKTATQPVTTLSNVTDPTIQGLADPHNGFLYAFGGTAVSTIDPNSSVIRLAFDYGSAPGLSSVVGASAPLDADPNGTGAISFDAAYYLRTNPDVAAAGIDPLTHFRTYGWKEGRQPNARFELFDKFFYLQKNPDVAASGMDPYQHYLTFGWKEGRDPAPDFSTAGYLAQNKDVAAAGINPLQHYAQSGLFEGRVAPIVGDWIP